MCFPVFGKCDFLFLIYTTLKWNGIIGRKSKLHIQWRMCEMLSRNSKEISRWNSSWEGFLELWGWGRASGWMAEEFAIRPSVRLSVGWPFAIPTICATEKWGQGQNSCLWGSSQDPCSGHFSRMTCLASCRSLRDRSWAMCLSACSGLGDTCRQMHRTFPVCSGILIYLSRPINMFRMWVRWILPPSSSEKQRELCGPYRVPVSMFKENEPITKQWQGCSFCEVDKWTGSSSMHWINSLPLSTSTSIPADMLQLLVIASP